MAGLGSVANIYFYQIQDEIDDGYFNDNSQSEPLLHFWSLAVEEQFYMITPLLLILLRKISPR